ncbi:MAG TPA: aminopeptidase [Candidatus Binatia bacterium]
MLRSLLFVFLILFSGCSPAYFFRAAYEEAKILWRRQPIEQMLEKDDLDKETREKLELVLAARSFAEETLHLTVGGSYSGYSYVDRPDVSYALTVAPGTSLSPYTWWFPIVGRVPYKGFFSENDARAAAQSFDREGYDTFVRPVSAFSTLGWFDDPLLARLLRLGKVTLVEIVLHELFHNTLFVRDAVDFNESLANFVGNRGAMAFFLQRRGERSAEYRQAERSWQEEREFSVMINELAAALKDLYQRALPENEKLELRQKLFRRAQEEWNHMTADRPEHHYRDFGKLEINNAVVAHFMLYLGNLHLFEAIYDAKGRDLPRFIKAVVEAVGQSTEPWQGVRRLLPSHTRNPAPGRTALNALS